MIKGSRAVQAEPSWKESRLFRPFGLSLSAQTSISTSAVLPKMMALELFKPFVFNKLEEKG